MLGEVDRQQSRLLGNLVSNVLAFLISGLILFLLTPVILNKLGDQRYGIWSFTVSVMVYSTIVGLGLPSAILRYFSSYHALQDKRQAAEIVNTALVILLPLSILFFILVIFLSPILPKFIGLNPQLHRQAALTFIIVGAEFSLALILSAFKQILLAIEKVIIYNMINIAVAFTRAILIYMLVWNQNLILLAGSSLASVLLDLGISIYAVHKLCPELQFNLSLFRREKLVDMLNYGLLVAIMNWAYVLVFSTDMIIIGISLSATSITIFSIASRLIEFERAVIGSIALVFIPRASALDSLNKTGTLQQLCLSGTKLCFMFSFVFTIFVVFLGKPLIKVWVGDLYATSVWIILILLSVGNIVTLTFASVGAILVGTGNHRSMVIMSAIEGISNLIFSVLFVKSLGVFGVALSTTIPYLVVTGPTMIYLTKMRLKLGMRTLFRTIFLPVLWVGCGLSLTLTILSILLYPLSVLSLGITAIIGSLVCIILYWLIALSREERTTFLSLTLTLWQNLFSTYKLVTRS